MARGSDEGEGAVRPPRPREPEGGTIGRREILLFAGKFCSDEQGVSLAGAAVESALAGGTAFLRPVRVPAPLPLVAASPADRAPERLEARVVVRADGDHVIEVEGEVRALFGRLDVVRVYAVGAVTAEQPRGDALALIAGFGGSSQLPPAECRIQVVHECSRVNRACGIGRIPIRSAYRSDAGTGR